MTGATFVDRIPLSWVLLYSLLAGTETGYSSVITFKLSLVQVLLLSSMATSSISYSLRNVSFLSLKA